MEDMGMTDLQFKDHLREVVAFLEKVAKMDSKEDMQKELQEFSERKKITFED